MLPYSRLTDIVYAQQNEEFNNEKMKDPIFPVFDNKWVNFSYLPDYIQMMGFMIIQTFSFFMMWNKNINLMKKKNYYIIKKLN